MLRVIHSQTVAHGILIDDIDDGLPNKQTYRLGSTGDPKAYVRDGHAFQAKQPCYVPYSRSGSSGTIAGYIDLNQTPRILLSAGKGKIAKLMQAGFASIITYTASQVVAPVIQVVSVGTNVIITGTTFTTLAPDVTAVTFVKGSAGSTPSPQAWSQSQITTAGGSISGTTITIPASAFTVAPVAGNITTVIANGKASNPATIAASPHITAAVHGVDPFVITGTGFVSTSPDTTAVTFAQSTGGTAAAPASFTQAAITGAGGSITGTTISIPASAFTQVPVANNTVKVNANGQDSNTFTIT